jgi:phosphate:Na+ symporter
VDGHNYLYILLGVLVGTITTVVVQSSSATIGITIALASQGLLNFEGAASLVLGDNIGTTITAILASIGANHHAKRAALAHTMFNTLGVAIILVLFYPFSLLIESLVPGMADLTVTTAEQASKYGMEIGAKPYIAQHIAMFHSVFNITNVIIFVPLVGFLAKVVTKIIPEPKTRQKKGAFQFSHIHYGLIDTPSIGIAESEKELIAMANRVKKNDARVMDLLHEKRSITDVFKKIERNEDLIDEYRNMITEFLLSLSQRSLSERDSNIVGNYITAAANLEKYADYLFNISVQYKKFKDSGLSLSEKGKENLTNAVGQISEYFRDVTTSLETHITEPEKFLKENEDRKIAIKKLIRKAKVSHFERLKEGKCQGDASMAYIEMLTNLDGMTSQVYNIAEIGAGTKFGL